MKDTKPPAFRGHTTPPPGLGGAELAKWIEENSSALMVSRDAEFSARQNRPNPFTVFTAPEKPPVPVAMKPPEATPIDGNQFDGIPLETPGECLAYRFSSDIPYREIEGRKPSDEAELIERIERLFALDMPETSLFEVEFHTVRMVKGFFLYDEDAAFEFQEEALQDYISIESFMAIWGRVKAPSWLIESLIQQVPMSWDHPRLDHFRGGKTRIRQLAGVSYRLQTFWGSQWFLMDQAVIAEVISRTQQDVSNCLKYLVDCQWLERRKKEGDTQQRIPLLGKP